MKRRRTKAEIYQAKEEAQLREESASQTIEQNEQLKQQLVQMEQEGTNNRKAANILTELMHKGLVQQDGNGNIDVPSASKKRPEHQ